MSNIFNIYLNINETNSNTQNINIYLNMNSLKNNNQTQEEIIINCDDNNNVINNIEAQEQILMNSNTINNINTINNEAQEQEQILMNSNDINTINNEIQEEILINENNIEPSAPPLPYNLEYIEPSAPPLPYNLEYIEPSAPPLDHNICHEIINESHNKIDKFSKKCFHYDNNIMIYANCCNKYFGCYKCHNEKSNHRIFSYNLKKIKCLSCNYDNKFDIKSNSCINCKTSFSKYNCKICCVWDNKMSYHCYKCDVCKYGDKNDCFHCDNCNMCIKNSAKNRHKCHLTNKDDDCSICLEKLFSKKNNDDNNNQIKFLNCGHILHFNCYSKMVRLNKTSCPLCRTQF